jgi:hypothetical protein
VAEVDDGVGDAIIRVGLALAERDEPPTAEAIYEALKAEGFDPPDVAEIQARARHILHVRLSAQDN